MTSLSLSDQLEETARETTEQAAFVLLSHTSNIDVDKVEWLPHWPAYLHGAGPVPPEAIVGCKVEARLTIRWLRPLDGARDFACAVAAIKSLEFSSVWLRAILLHEPPPYCTTGAEDIKDFTWEVKRSWKHDPEYDAHNEKLSLPVKLIGCVTPRAGARAS